MNECPASWKTKVLVPALLTVKRWTWQPAQSPGFADGVPCVPMIVAAAFQLGGNQPARAKRGGPWGGGARGRVARGRPDAARRHGLALRATPVGCRPSGRAKRERRR